MDAGPPFDPYHAWLDIDPHEQPADHYRLLGVARFETDPTRIARAADERMALVRSFQMGPRRAFTQKLLNELSAARVVLLQPEAKAEYDTKLAQRMTADQASRYVTHAPPPAPSPEPPRVEDSIPVASFPAQNMARERSARTSKRTSALWLLGGTVILGVVLAGYLVAGVLTKNNPRPPRTDRPAVAVDPTPQVENLPSADIGPARRPVLVTADPNGEILLTPEAAALTGQVQLESLGPATVLTDWMDADSQVMWTFRLAKPGFCSAELTYSATSEDGGDVELILDGRPRVCSLRTSGGKDQFLTDTFTIAITKSGEHTLTLRPRHGRSAAWLTIRTLRLIPLMTGSATSAQP